MPLSTVRVKIKQNNQTIDERDLLLDPKDDAAIRAALLDALRDLGEEPARRHRIQVYKPNGEWIRELYAS